jgi:hypothetical protein
MASSSKRKTTMAKLNRERKLQERRLEKQARREERKLRAAAPAQGTDEIGPSDETDDSPSQHSGPAV